MTDNSLLQDFIVETGEHLADTERNLLFLEQQPQDVQVLNEIFRSIHTIKGSSEYLGLERIAELSHKLENLLDLLRRGERLLDRGVIDVLIGTNDRIAQLVDDLAQYQQERAGIGDLVSLIDACCGLAKPVTAEEAGGDGSSGDGDEIQDEYDEELFGIFLDQLKSGLQALCEDTCKLQSGEDAARLLARYEDRLGTLRSSANYMGYEKLKQVYVQWSQGVAGYAERSGRGEPIDRHLFAREVTAHNLERVKRFFPKIDLLQQVTLEMVEPEAMAPVPMIEADSAMDIEELRFDDIAIELADELSASPVPDFDSEPQTFMAASPEKADHSLLEDFILETGEHLAAMERSLLLLEQQPQDEQLLNEIFRSIHTIKGSSEYLGLERVAELSHKLENLLDQLRCGERVLDRALVDVLIGTHDRIAQLVDDLAQYQHERTTIDDLVSLLDDSNRLAQPAAAEPEGTEGALPDDNDEIHDEYDEELFGIFLDQLKGGLQSLCELTQKLQSGEDHVRLLAGYEDQLSTLLSSANYMGYEKLKQVYVQWLQEVTVFIERSGSGEQFDRHLFARQVTVDNLERVKRFFPKIDFLQQVTLQADETQMSGSIEMSVEPSIASDDAVEPGPAPVENIDQELLADFIAESAEHLDEFGHNLQQLAQHSTSPELLKDLFRAVHTIKGSAEYLGIARVAELTHRLENLLDMLRRDQLVADRDVADLLIAAKTRIVQLMDDLVQQQAEQTPVEDLVLRIDQLCETPQVKAVEPASEPAEPAAFESAEPVVPESAEPVTHELQAPEPSVSGIAYEEIYDRELFAIFTRQMLQSLADLEKETAELESGKDALSGIDCCLQLLRKLRASANYMEYFDLKESYDRWLADLETVRRRAVQGEAPDWADWADRMVPAYIARVRSFFNFEPSVALDEAPEPEPIADIAVEELEETAAEVASEEIAGQDASSAEEQSLLEQLEKAFDDKINDAAGGFGSDLFQAEVANHLLSGEDDFTAPFDAGLINTSDLGIEKAESGSVLESLLFSNSDSRKTSRRTLAPKPLAELIENNDSVPLPLEETDERRGHFTMGRRQNDKFRDRLQKQSIRVDAAKIDALMNQVGELVVTRAGFNQLFFDMREFQLMLKQVQKLDGNIGQTAKELTNRINAATLALSRITSELQENVMKVRMLPIAQLFSRYPRVVHDLVRNTAKQVELDIRGEETELDRMVIEQISDPLMHIIRNAVDHGIEPVAERQRKGKKDAGTLRLEAYHEGNSVVIEVSDDGHGIDAEKIKAKAVANGYAGAVEIESMGQEEIMAFIMRPGFSTADEVTHTSGRGVGMDVVKDHVEKLNGTITIDSTPDRGALFRIKIPLTLAIIQALMVGVSGETFTIPLSAVDETIRIRNSEVSSIEGMEVYYLREHALPLIRLDRVFKMDHRTGGQEIFVVVVNTGNRQVGLVVDHLKGREEVVIKPLEDYLQEKSGFSGATILGDGSISLILDVGDIMHLAVDQHIRKTKVAVL